MSFWKSQIAMLPWLLCFAGCTGEGTTQAGDDAGSPPSGAPTGILTVSTRLNIVDIDVGSGRSRVVTDGRGLSATVSGGGDIGMGGQYLFVGDDEIDGLGYALWRLDGTAGTLAQWLSIDDSFVTIAPWQPRISPTTQYVSVVVWGYDPRTLEGEHQPHVLLYENRDGVDYRTDVMRVLGPFDAAAWTPPTDDAPFGRLVLVQTDTYRLFVTDAQIRDTIEIPWDTALGSPKQAEPSPDGRKLVVATNQGDLFVGDFDASGPQLTNVRRVRTASAAQLAADPVFSADGRWIAHLWGASFNLRDVVISSAETEISPLPIQRDDGAGTWAPVESQIWWR